MSYKNLDEYIREFKDTFTIDNLVTASNNLFSNITYTDMMRFETFSLLYTKYLYYLYRGEAITDDEISSNFTNKINKSIPTKHLATINEGYLYKHSHWEFCKHQKPFTS